MYALQTGIHEGTFSLRKCMGIVRCHNPVAADIDVTDNCFCTVFFAGLYLSSSFNKTAIIFHKNNEVFVNCEIGWD